MNPPDPTSTLPETDDRNGSPRRPLDIAEAECALASGNIANVQGIMRWGSNYAALVSVSDGEDILTAVYKPQRGERSLMGFSRRDAVLPRGACVSCIAGARLGAGPGDGPA